MFLHIQIVTFRYISLFSATSQYDLSHSLSLSLSCLKSFGQTGPFGEIAPQFGEIASAMATKGNQNHFS